MPNTETQFERKRGIHSIEVRSGCTQVSVHNLDEPAVESRLAVLELVSELGISIDFLKLSPHEISFVIDHSDAKLLKANQSKFCGQLDLHEDRSVVLVHAANIREEEGLGAKILSSTLQLGNVIDHIGDMHDRLLLVVPSEEAESVKDHIQRELTESTT